MSDQPKQLKSIAQQLAEGQNPSGEVASAPVDQNVLLHLVRLMASKEAREAAKQDQEIAQHAAKQVQRDRNAKDQDSKILLKQARCKHLKGGKRGPKNQNLDYAVSKHLFIHAVEYIRCLVCGMRWFPNDTVEYLVRTNDKTGVVSKISNHTHIGWREAIKMTEQSTNTQTKSEMLVTTMAQANPAAFMRQVDSAGKETTARVVDLEGNIVSDVQL
jgi:hypothetical protein